MTPFCFWHIVHEEDKKAMLDIPAIERLRRQTLR